MTAVQLVSRRTRGVLPARTGGLSLIELMVTIAVLAIVTTVAVPSMRGVINGNRITAATNDMVGMVQAARMEAIRRNSRVTLCPTQNGTTCAGTNWRRTVILAADNSAVRELNLPQNIVVRASEAISGASPAHQIVFRPDGLARQGTARTIINGRIEVCMVTAQPQLNARRIAVFGARASVDPPLTSADCEATVSNT